jgi:polysaccharide biosynthesis/export protein
MAHSIRSWFLMAAALSGAALLWGCSMPPRTNVDRVEAPREVIASSTRFKKEYVLFAGDQVEIVVMRFPEVSRTVTIRSDGLISLPMLQDVPAAGLTARELADDLRARFSTRLLNPEVAVIPVQVRQPNVYVLGDVKSPSAIPYRNAQTVLQAIGLAGGFQRSGSEGDVTIIRLSKEGYLEAIPVDVSAHGQPGPYLALGLHALQPDDVVFVPEHGRSQVVRFIDDMIMRPAQLFITYKLYREL